MQNREPEDEERVVSLDDLRAAVGGRSAVREGLVVALERHQDAERLMVLGDEASAAGDFERAKQHYRAAAEAEAEVYNLVPPDKPRTRGITALSVVSLFRRSGDSFEAQLRAHAFLAEPTLAEWARADLLDMTADLRDEAESSSTV